MEVGGCAVVLPVSHTVAYEHALKVRYPLASFLGLIDEPVETKHDLRHVDPSVRLSSDPHLVVLDGGELITEESKHNLEVVISTVVVVPLAVLQHISADRVADVGGAFDIEHIGFVVPRPVIEGEIICSILKRVGSMLLSPSEHRGAARTSIEPDDDRIINGIVSAQGG